MSILRKWWLKCMAQRLLSHVPAGVRINSAPRRGERCRELDRVTLHQGLSYVRLLRSTGFDFTDRVALELGAGWKPIIPCILRIAGCRKVILYDVHPLMDRQLLAATYTQLRAVAATIATQLQTRVRDVEEIIPEAGSHDFATLLAAAGFEYRAPCATTRLNEPDGSIDFISSRAVLEHIPSDKLPRLFDEFRRVISARGMMLHAIDHADHWHNVDPGITRLNFLKFPRWWWRVINSPLAYQNRLRSIEYVRMFVAAGFEIHDIQARIDSQALEVIRSIPVHVDFCAFSPEQLAVLRSRIIAVPADDSRRVSRAEANLALSSVR